MESIHIQITRKHVARSKHVATPMQPILPRYSVIFHSAPDLHLRNKNQIYAT